MSEDQNFSLYADQRATDSDPPRVTPRRPLRLTALVWIPVLTVALLAVAPLIERIQYASTRGRLMAEAEVAETQLARLTDTSEAFRWVARRVEPSVVHIETRRATRTSAEDPQRDPRLPLFGHPREFLTQGQGSGVIVDDAGYILTNNHVIEGATGITVQLGDGREIDNVAVVGRDPQTDLAVLKVEAEGLSTVAWGDSEELEVGDWVLAVGNPFGLDRTVTSGIVSAKSRRVLDHSTFQDYLQTDAAVNPGSSGGPLVNLRGEVVGITTAIVGSSYQGVSFAIPSRIARGIYEQLKTSGRAIRGWLGVMMENVASEDAAANGSGPRGVRVLAVVVGSPADQAGLEIGDIILRWGGVDVHGPADLKLEVAATAVGSQVEAEILRENEPLTVNVSVGQTPDGEVRMRR